MVRRIITQQVELLAQDVMEGVAAPAAKRMSKAASQGAAAAANAGQAAKVAQKQVSRALGGTLGLTGERMSRVDTAWLRMDTPENLMMIIGVWVLKPGIRIEAMRTRVQEKMLKFNRFKQRVVEDAAGATWVLDKKFDIANHVMPEELDMKLHSNVQQALQHRVAELAV